MAFAGFLFSLIQNNVFYLSSFGFLLLLLFGLFIFVLFCLRQVLLYPMLAWNLTLNFKHWLYNNEQLSPLIDWKFGMDLCSLSNRERSFQVRLPPPPWVLELKALPPCSVYTQCWGSKPKVLCVVGKASTSDLHPQPFLISFLKHLNMVKHVCPQNQC